MFDLKIGDVVWHKGVKRKITFVRQFAGATFCYLSGYGYLTHRGQFKPVLTVCNGVVIAGPKCLSVRG